MQSLGRAGRLALLAIAAALMLAHCWVFREFTVDDAAISYSYARSLAEGYGLVLFPGGERVEGYSNFTWVLLLALGQRLGGELFVVAKWLGALCAVLTVVGVAELVAALRGRRSPVDALAALLVAGVTPVAYWSMCGLESPLYLALIVWCAVRLVREADDPARRPLSALLAAGIALTRPDGLLVAAAAGVARLLSPDRRRRALAAWGALAAAPVAAHLAWRYSYYAWPYPNTYYAKLAAAAPFRLAELTHWRSPGWNYVITQKLRNRAQPAVWLAALALVRWRRLTPRLMVVPLFAAALFFPIYARGDWMNEGRFTVQLAPLLAALAVDGCERLAELAPWVRARSAVAAALAAALLAWVLPNAYRLTLARRGNYPVPAAFVGIRAKAYAQLAVDLEMPHPSVIDGDLGGTSWWAQMPVVDMGGLTDVTFSRVSQNAPALREYMYDERQPTIADQVGFWLDNHLTRYPEWSDRYIALHRAVWGTQGLYLARANFTVDGIDTRRPLARLGGLDVIGSAVGSDEVRLWLLVRQAGAAPLELVAESTRPVTIGQDLYHPDEWRVGEVLWTRVLRPSGAGLKLCGAGACVALAEGTSGALPVALPAPERTTLARLQARADWTVLAAVGERAAGAPLHQRALAADRAGDGARAFRDEAAALRVDPALAFARRHLESLRDARREPYRYRWVARLDAATRALQLDPDEAHFAALVAAAAAAGRPDVAVRAHRAFGWVPAATAERLALAEAYAALGLAADGAALLSPGQAARLAGELGPDAALRGVALAGAAGRSDLAAAALAPLGATPVAVAPGLRLVAAAARPLRSGWIELALALQRSPSPNGAAAEVLSVGGQEVPFDRSPARWEEGERFVHPVQLHLARGRSTVAVGSAQLTVEAAPFAADFESGAFDGWSGDGAFPPQPHRRAANRSVEGNYGVYYADTAAPAAGTLRSLPLADAVEQVCFVVGGMRDAGRAGVALEIAGVRGPAAAGSGEGMLREACLDARVAGERRIVLYGGGAGGVWADDFECVGGGRPVDCVAGTRVSGL